MSAPPYMPLYVADYLSDTTGLTTEQHGAYLLLLMAMWRAGGRLPNEAAKLARFARLSPAKWAKLERDVLQLFTLSEDGCITHKRLAAEFEKAAKTSSVRAQSGSRGGKTTAMKNKKKSPASAADLVQHTQISESDIDSSPKGDSSFFEVVPVKKSDPIEDAFLLWNEMAKRAGLSVAMKLTPARKAALRLRIKEVGPEGWAFAVSAVEGNPFFHGENDRGWRADLDFLLQPSKLTKVIEGGYERTPNGPPGYGSSPAIDRRTANLHAMARGAQEALARRRGRWGGGAADFD